MGAVFSCCARPGRSAKAKRKEARKKSSQRAAEDLRRMAAMRPIRGKQVVPRETIAKLASSSTPTPTTSTLSDELKRARIEKLHTERNAEMLKLYGHRAPPPSTLLQLSANATEERSRPGSASPGPPRQIRSATSSPHLASRLQRNMRSGTGSGSSGSLNRPRRHSLSQLMRTSPSPSLTHSPQDKKTVLVEECKRAEAEEEQEPLTELEQFASEFKKMPSKKEPEPAGTPKMESEGRWRIDSDGPGPLASGDYDAVSERSMGNVTPMYGAGQIVETHLFNGPTFGDIELGLSARGVSSNAMVLLEVRSVANLIYRSAPDFRPSIYVKAYLQSDDGTKVHKRKTKGRQGRDNVIFDEVLMFRSQGLDKIMKVMVWEDHGVLGRNVMQGEVLVDLSLLDLRTGSHACYPLFAPYSSSTANLSPAESMMSLSSSFSTDPGGQSPRKLISGGSQHSIKKKGFRKSLR
eukprot:scpid27726/ scgid6147/ Regulating synaptic membrane exocytosis protein 1; Rab-3-interacting molecule 1; Rab-3-interacting protein 2